MVSACGNLGNISRRDICQQLGGRRAKSSISKLPHQELDFAKLKTLTQLALLHITNNQPPFSPITAASATTTSNLLGSPRHSHTVILTTEHILEKQTNKTSTSLSRERKLGPMVIPPVWRTGGL